MTVAVTGAAGYIGSHVAHLLAEAGIHVLAVDDMSAGLGSRIEQFPLVEIDLARDEAPGVLRAAFAQHQVRAVVHLAARKAVGESVEQPMRYYSQNVTGLANVLTAMQQSGVDRFVFSSSAATYGMPDVDLVSEDQRCEPINPYGETKLVGEWLVRAATRSSDLRAVSLRYFNVAGTGRPELADTVVANLVPILLQRAAEGVPAAVFGDDYPTPDGTCVRDYVHVADLAEAHVRALTYLERDDRPHDVFNVGSGTGASVMDVVEALSRALGQEVATVVEPRRAGDPPRLVASVERISSVLGWHATRDLDEICRSAVEAARAR
ncbi:UDP-glucose 4-epimerase GalE [Aquipuribacter hungaricus]|uniref:UDP-glucose 4-epimerase n=1 Tax=Aquipuribacter hungaricus TaxID=545624 RepID=A0ABV7WDC7_9MICO